MAYARAPLVKGSAPAVFSDQGRLDKPGNTVFFEDVSYAKRLRLRLIRLDVEQSGLDREISARDEEQCESLVHIRTTPPHDALSIEVENSGPILLDTRDTIALTPGERATLRLAADSSVLVLVVLAKP